MVRDVYFKVYGNGEKHEKYTSRTVMETTTLVLSIRR